MKIVIDIPDEWKTRIANNRRPSTIECGQLVESIWKGKILPKGKWIRNERDEDGIYCKCSNCGHLSLLDYDYTGFEDDLETWDMFDFDTVPLKNKNYCSSCGAKMEDQNGF